MEKIRTFIHSTIKRLNISVIFLMFLVLIIQVITRKLFNDPLPWPEELSLIAMIWITFFGAYQCTIEENHLKMDFLQSKISEKMKPFLSIVAKGFVVWFLIVTCYMGFSFIQQAGNIKMPVSGLPMWIPYWIIWSSFFLMLIEFIAQIILHIREIVSPSKQKGGDEECSQS
ncbi:TRAP transporter small permease [Psychrobacillus soli]|uniref:TRAP transporter small permease n=1 Tax=Psychrobacillus soli TaxID=1543965 RepID=A0A544T5R4_9BACI|nr:TRAP transporter small permease [Psychrobacillus soli]TQR12728.1 TRAP transporter small permease [Psychrobacillus soli]